MRKKITPPKEELYNLFIVQNQISNSFGATLSSEQESGR